MSVETIFSPNEVTDEALAELRMSALGCMDTAGKFAFWLHGWCDHEQHRRQQEIQTCGKWHFIGWPDVSEWSNTSVGEALETTHVLHLGLSDWTGQAMMLRAHTMLTMEAGRRLRGIEDGN